MRKELDKKLCEDFPLLYGDRNAPMQHTCMCWGFDCGDGWYDLIYELSSKLEALIQKFKDEDPSDVKDYGLPRAAQVKEKFGGLRFYMTSGTDGMFDLIEEAEGKSNVICEWCGNPGEQNGSGWIRTLCDDCAKNFRKKQQEQWLEWEKRQKK